MIRIDGSTYSGSGTLLRYAAALVTLVGEPLHMFRIRAGREKVGLRPQHLQALRACSGLCNGRLEGDEVGSQEIFYFPGKRIEGGQFHWDIGTAGSTTMLAFTVIPLGLFAGSPCSFSIAGGLFQDYAPSGFHMQRVLFPLIRRMGARGGGIEIRRPGYVPEGQGHLAVHLEPLDRPLEPLGMIEQGKVKTLFGASLASHLERERVSERMAARCKELLRANGFEPRIEVLDDHTAVQKGAALLLWAETDTGCLLGADRAGKRGRKSESIAEHVVDSLMEDMATGATTDRHLADQLILFAALAKGRTEYLIPRVTGHIESNLWIVNKVLGAGAELRGNHLSIEGIGLLPSKR